jgi:hypothetical protein
MTTTKNTVSNARLTWAGAFAILSLITLPSGLLDPLEGFAALVVGIIALVFARGLSRVKVAKLALIPLILALVIMAVILTLSFIAQDSSALQIEGPTVDNWLALSVVVWLLPQALMVVLVIIGLVIYAARIFRTRKPVAAKPAKKS